MSTQFAHIPLEQIHEHPNNPRRNAVASQELVDSIKSVGLLQALLVAPAADGYTLIAGHCRKDGLVKAGATTAACVIRTDLITEAQQVEAMLVENGRRSDLTPIEEAAGYAQLELFGYKPKDIAHATGVSAATVKARLKLNRLPDTARDRLHDGQLTLGDAESLVEFADEPEVLADLEKKIGTSNFRWAIEQARSDRETRQRHAKIIAGFEDDGIREVEHPGMWDQDKGPVLLSWTSAKEPEGHKGCLAYVRPRSKWTDPQLVCTNPAAHPKDETSAGDDDREQRDAEWEAQRAAREAELAAHRAAARVRIDHMVKHFAGLYTTKTVTSAQLAALRITVPLTLARNDGTLDENAYMHAAGLDSDLSWWSICEPHSAEVAAMTPAKFLNAYAALHAAQIELLLSEAGDPGSAAAWHWLLSTGYQPSDIDQALIDEARQASNDSAA